MTNKMQFSIFIETCVFSMWSYQTSERVLPFRISEHGTSVKQYPNLMLLMHHVEIHPD